MFTSLSTAPQNKSSSSISNTLVYLSFLLFGLLAGNKLLGNIPPKLWLKRYWITMQQMDSLLRQFILIFPTWTSLLTSQLIKPNSLTWTSSPKGSKMQDKSSSLSSMLPFQLKMLQIKTFTIQWVILTISLSSQVFTPARPMATT